MEDKVKLISSMAKKIHLHGQKYEAVCLCKLDGHEGSIFRIAWYSDGSKLISVSDDRRCVSFMTCCILIAISWIQTLVKRFRMSDDSSVFVSAVPVSGQFMIGKNLMIPWRLLAPTQLALYYLDTWLGFGTAAYLTM